MISLRARFASTCPRCHGRIEVGQEIIRTDSGYAHTDCQPAPAPVPRPWKTESLTPGVYEQDNSIFLVRMNREKTHLYAERLVETSGDRLTEDGDRVHFEFEYAKGAIFNLRPDSKMSVERAKALMVRYGRCIVCGRHLKDATSVERGIGPVCRKYFREEVAA